MIINQYEFSLIKNNKLPKEWRDSRELDRLEVFLQENWEQRTVFYDDGIISSKQQYLGFTNNQGIKTKNYVGTIVYKGETLNIFPKVFREDIDDNDTTELSSEHLMNNLVRWLDYCTKMEYPFINISSVFDDSNNLKELFIALYIGYVRQALDRQVFYQYIETTENNSFIKGKFNIRDYFFRKIPNGNCHKFECTYSSFEFDNLVNRIIKYTCTQLFNDTSAKNKKKLRGILGKLNEVSYIRCVPSDCDSIKANSLPKLYKTIISMSKMILLNQVSSVFEGQEDNFCFLFPTELLFEGFISGFIKEFFEARGSKVQLQKSDMYLIDDVIFDNESLGASFKMRHDIFIKSNNLEIILDTKYKSISRFEGNKELVKTIVNDEQEQTDVYQVCEYARRRNVDDVYLIYPMFRYEDIEPSFPMGISKGKGSPINIHFLRVPFVFEDQVDVYDKLTKLLSETLCLCL